MEIEALRKTLTSYDFQAKSMKSFSDKYNISIKTIKKYLDLFKIDYPKRKKSGVTMKRDRFGRFNSNFKIDKDKLITNDTPSNTNWNDAYLHMIESKPITIKR